MSRIDISLDSGEDVGAVATCVAELLAAFWEGGAILGHVKQKRSDKRAPALPQILEDAIVQSPEDIQRETLRGVARYGEQFELGDPKAVFALQRVTIALQSSLNKLHGLEHNDANIAVVTEAADMARDIAITTLVALRQRLQAGQADKVRTVNTPSLLSASASSTSSPAISSPRTINSIMTSFPSVPHDLVREHVPPLQSRPPVPPRSLRRERIYFEQSSSSLLPPGDAQRLAYKAVKEDRLEVQSPVNAFSGCVAVDIYSNASPYRQPSHSAGSVTTRDESRRASSQCLGVTELNSLHVTTTNIHPDKSNIYLGFCKAAWKLQCGEQKAFHKAKDFTQSAQSKSYYLTCSKTFCAFKGRGTKAVTDQVITDLERGLKFRWSFFGKSHVFMKSAANEQYLYLCMFCVFAGQQQVAMNSKPLLEHISQDHRSGSLSEVLLDRTRCIQNRMCKDTEKFDINIFKPAREISISRDAGVYRPVYSAKHEESGIRSPPLYEKLAELY